MDTYLEIIDIRTEDCRKTGMGAVFKTKAETEQSFNAARSLEVDKDNAQFLLDFHSSGNLIDTILLDDEGFRAITGEKPKSAEEYTRFDMQYWANILADQR